MSFQILKKHLWFEQNERITALYQEYWGRMDLSVRVYPDPILAITELVQGTASFQSHRRTVGVVTGASWVQLPILSQLLKEGLTIREISFSELKDPDALADSFGGDCSVIFWPVDHPVLDDETLCTHADEVFTKRRITSIRYSHWVWAHRVPAPSPYSIHLAQCAAGGAVALLGSRVKTPPALVPYFRIRFEDQDYFPGARDAADESLIREQVKRFESKLPMGYSVIGSSDRYGLRSVISNSSMSGEKAFLNLNIQPSREAWTLQLCQHGLTFNELAWWKSAPSADLIRGLLIFEPYFFATHDSGGAKVL